MPLADMVEPRTAGLAACVLIDYLCVAPSKVTAYIQKMVKSVQNKYSGLSSHFT